MLLSNFPQAQDISRYSITYTLIYCNDCNAHTVLNQFYFTTINQSLNYVYRRVCRAPKGKQL